MITTLQKMIIVCAVAGFASVLSFPAWAGWDADCGGGMSCSWDDGPKDNSPSPRERDYDVDTDPDPPAPEVVREPSSQEKAYDINLQGNAAYNAGNFETAEDYYRRALELLPDDQVYVRNLALAVERQGVVADNNGNHLLAESYHRKALNILPATPEFIANLSSTLESEGYNAAQAGHYSAAEGYYREALDLAPGNSETSHNLSSVLVKEGYELSAQNKNDEALRYYQEAQALNPESRDTSWLVSYMQSEIQREKAAVQSDIDRKQSVLSQAIQTKHDSGGTAVGSDTKASDQLLSAAAHARDGEDLTINYDAGGAKKSGSLTWPDHSSIDPSTFTEQEKNDPKMVAVLGEMNDLQAKRSEMDTKIQQLTVERGREHDSQKMDELTQKLDKMNGEYQTTLAAIVDKTEDIRKTKRLIDTEQEKKTPEAKN